MGRMDQPLYGMIQPRDAASASKLRQHFVAASGEFVGTFLFLFMAFLGHIMSVDQAPRANTGPNGTNASQTVIYISMSYGLSLLVTVWVMYRVSGGLYVSLRNTINELDKKY